MWFWTNNKLSKTCFYCNYCKVIATLSLKDFLILDNYGQK